MKKESVNQFNGGLNVDLHPMVTPNSVLTDDLNGTFITYNGNEFCLQNDRGNFEVAHLSDGYVPIGAKEYNGIIYIVSVKNALNNDGEIVLDECLTEIGTYPGVDWNIDKETENVFCYKDGEPEGRLAYTPLGNYDNGAFTGVPLGYSTANPVTMEIQPSYDGSVNLIITDGVNPVRMVNSAFSVLPNEKYKLIERRGTYPTNYYSSDELESLTLIRNSNCLSNISLNEVTSGGQLKGGNYTFYVKFGDDDFNQTDVVAESSIVSIFNGNDCTPYTISGTLLDERTDKKVSLTIEGLDTNYSKIYIYYSREYSDTLGYRLTEYGVFKKPFTIDKAKTSQKIWLTGYEQTETINSEEINIDYHTVDYARAEAQQQSMLFLGNVGQSETYQLYNELQSVANTIETTISCDKKLSSVSFLYNKNTTCSANNAEYYSTQNIYNNLGYWPNEWYRFGVVFILNDGSTTPVFNMRGGYFTPDGANKWKRVGWNGEGTTPSGVFKTPDANILTSDGIQPLYFTFTIGSLPPEVKGYFYVRQKRIPTTICQGLRLGVDKRSHLPITWNGKTWITQSFLSVERWLSQVTGVHKACGLVPKLEYYNKSIIPDDNSLTYFNLLDDVAYLSEYTVDDLDNYQEAINLGQVVYGEDYEHRAISSDDVEPTVYIYHFVKCYTFNLTSKTFEEYPNEDFYYVTYTEKENLPNPLNRTYWAETKELALSGATAEQSERLRTNVNPSSTSSAIGQKDFAKKYIVYSDTSIDNYGYGLLSLDPAVAPSVRNILDGSEFNVIEEYKTKTKFGSSTQMTQYTNLSSNDPNDSFLQIQEETQNKIADQGSISQCVYVAPNTKIKEVGGIGFSTVAGDASDPSQYSYTTITKGVKTKYKKKRGKDNNWSYYAQNLTNEHNTIVENTVEATKTNWNIGFNSIVNVNIIRGLFTPFIGLTKQLTDHGIYSIRLKEPTDSEAKLVRAQDESAYYSVSRRIDSSEISVYQGDCYTSTVSMRILKNFIDSDVPVSDNIVDFDNWDEYVRSAGDEDCDQSDSESVKNGYPDWNQVNRADVNTVDLGYWITFKCLSSYNLGLRSLDRSNEKEMSIMGNPRSFFPLNGGSTSTGNKVGESFLLNDGYSATVGEKRYNLYDSTLPYTQTEFANRIIFSNVQVDNSYTNGYRTFQGLSYQDYDKQYGEIVKLVPWDNNLLVVMEHGIGVVGVNEQALLQTNTADTIHIYGHGVLSDHMQMISQDFGSKYEHSVIRTPIGVYGIDTDARKVWRVSTQKGFETLSDMKIESYLNDELGTNASIDLPLVDVRTHYNATKGDIMFTFFKKLFKKRPKTVAPVEEKKYFNISTGDVVMNQNSTSSRNFSTNYPVNQITVTISDEDLISYSISNSGITFSSNDKSGSCLVTICDKKFNVVVRTAAEEFQNEQSNISNETNTIVNTETNPETGTDEVVVTSKLTITLGTHPWSMKVGQTYTIPVYFANNINNITLTDCEIKSVFEDGAEVELVISGNNLLVTPKKDGKWRFGINYPNAKGFDVSWIEFTTPTFGALPTSVSVWKGYTETTTYFNNAGTVTVTPSSTTVAQAGVTPNLNKIWFTGLSAGTSEFEISDGTTSEIITVTVTEPNALEDVDFYDEGNPTEHNSFNPTNFTMHVGESKRIMFQYIPSDYEKSVYHVTIGGDAQTIVVNKTLELTYSQSGGKTSPGVADYVDGDGYYDPYIIVDAKKKGSGTFNVTLWKVKSSGGYTKIKDYICNVTIDE